MVTFVAAHASITVLTAGIIFTTVIFGAVEREEFVVIEWLCWPSTFFGDPVHSAFAPWVAAQDPPHTQKCTFDNPVGS